ncbi:MAG: DUF3515 domain-containing protein [Micromonosporaceae bacterium]|nr:DUF3515 domain-containing protein [Micromonosporaceae bacterium]
MAPATVTVARATAPSSSSDPIRRRAAIIATLVALPIALAVLLISVFVFGAPSPEPAATGPVTVTERSLSPEVAGLCQAVIADLPDTAAGHARRPVTAGSEQNAAYGDPPIIVECGTELPAVGDTDLVYPLSGVCWYSVTEADRTVWTTVDRTVPVTVTVPGPPDGAAQFVVPFSNAIGTNLPLRDPAPTGCSGPVPTTT